MRNTKTYKANYRIQNNKRYKSKSKTTNLPMKQTKRNSSYKVDKAHVPIVKHELQPGLAVSVIGGIMLFSFLAPPVSDVVQKNDTNDAHDAGTANSTKLKPRV